MTSRSSNGTRRTMTHFILNVDNTASLPFSASLSLFFARLSISMYFSLNEKLHNSLYLCYLIHSIARQYLLEGRKLHSFHHSVICGWMNDLRKRSLLDLSWIITRYFPFLQSFLPAEIPTIAVHFTSRAAIIQRCVKLRIFLSLFFPN